MAQEPESNVMMTQQEQHRFDLFALERENPDLRPLIKSLKPFGLLDKSQRSTPMLRTTPQTPVGQRVAGKLRWEIDMQIKELDDQRCKHLHRSGAPQREERD
uniref:Uncharacterized protein n=1 Tax=Romanomermis culicivorax TaxID=13658 RepID=A0A915JYG6_ROMCU